MRAAIAAAAVASADHSCRPWCRPLLFQSDDLMFAGKWRETSREESAHPPCCGWDNNAGSEPACSLNASTFRRDKDQSYAGPSSGWAKSGGYGCKCEPSAHYTWDAPTSCRLLAWDAREFCRVLSPEKNVLLVGDSTMEQAASTLMNAVIQGRGGCEGRIR